MGQNTDSAENDRQNLQIDDLNPTFLFAWKGTRTRTEENYHSHDFLELVVFLAGTGKYRIDDELYDVAEGDLLILNPGVRHQFLLFEDNEMPTTEFFIGFSDIQLVGQERNLFPLPEPGNLLHTAGELRQKLFKLCSSIEAENAVSRQGRYFMLKAYLMQLLLTVIRDQSEPVAYTGGYSFESVNRKYVVEQIVSYFEEHYDEKISLDQIAGNMYLSPYYVARIFKSETGDTPIHHLINIRLEKARELLESGEAMSIQKVAASVGYDDAYYFSKLFKKRYGVPPSKVRGGTGH